MAATMNSLSIEYLHKSLPIEYLHLESGVILLFLAMVIWTQFGRAADPNYDVQRGHPQLRWLPFSLVLMSAAFSGLLYRTSPLLGLELGAGIALSMLHPANALCFMVHLMILRPWEIDVGNPVLMLIPRIVVLLCIFSWAIHPEQRARLSWRSLRGVLFLIGFSLWLLVTTIKVPDMAAGVADWFDTYLKSLTIFVMALFLIESERSVREFELTLIISSLSLMVSGLYQFLSGGMTSGRLLFGRPYNTLGDPNDLGAIIVMALPFALVPVFEETTGPMTKAAGLIYAGFAAIVIWLTRSRGAMLSVVVQLIVVRLVRSKRRRLSLLLVAGLVGAGYLGLMRLVPRRADDMAASSGSRITFWKTAVNMAVHNPILGVGFNQFPDKYMSYVVGTVYEQGRRTAHSSWLLALGESGFVGCFLFCAFFISVARIAWRNRAKRPAQLYAVVGYGTALSFLSHTYSPYYYLLMGLVLASTSVKKRINDGT